MEAQLKKDLGNRLALAERKLQQSQEERGREVRELKAQVEGIRDQLPDTVNEDVNGQAALRSTLAGSFIRIAQLHRVDSARQDQLNVTE